MIIAISNSETYFERKNKFGLSESTCCGSVDESLNQVTFGEDPQHPLPPPQVPVTLPCHPPLHLLTIVIMLVLDIIAQHHQLRNHYCNIVRHSSQGIPIPQGISGLPPFSIEQGATHNFGLELRQGSHFLRPTSQNLSSISHFPRPTSYTLGGWPHTLLWPLQ